MRKHFLKFIEGALVVAGILFDDDDLKHMSCSVNASYGKMGMTEMRIGGQEDPKSVKSSA